MKFLCENCGKEHDGLYGSGRFCCSLYSRSFATKAKRDEINKKVLKKIKQNTKIINCSKCGSIIEVFACSHVNLCENCQSDKLKSNIIKFIKGKLSHER